MDSKYVLGAMALSAGLLPLSEVLASDLFYEVKEGDTISSIAQKLYVKHDGLNYHQYYSLLSEINKEKFKSLDKIFPGDKVLLPTDNQVAQERAKHGKSHRAVASMEKKEGFDQYKVQKGDTLSEIAQKYITWKDIYSSNGTVNYILKNNPHIKNADFIVENQIIYLPNTEEVAKSFRPQEHTGRLPSSDEESQKYKEEALNPDFSFNGLRFNNMPKKKRAVVTATREIV